MCLFSEEFRTKPLEVGQTTTFGTVTGTHTGRITAALPVNADETVKCLCLANNSIVRLSNLSLAAQITNGLVSANAIAVFRQGVRDTSKKDRFEFDNGSIANLNKRFQGATVTMLAKSMAEYLAGEAGKAKASGSAPDKEQVLVGVGSRQVSRHMMPGHPAVRRVRIPAGILGLPNSTFLRNSAGLMVLAALAIHLIR